MDLVILYICSNQQETVIFVHKIRIKQPHYYEGGTISRHFLYKRFFSVISKSYDLGVLVDL